MLKPRPPFTAFHEWNLSSCHLQDLHPFQLLLHTILCAACISSLAARFMFHLLVIKHQQDHLLCPSHGRLPLIDLARKSDALPANCSYRLLLPVVFDRLTSSAYLVLAVCCQLFICCFATSFLGLRFRRRPLFFCGSLLDSSHYGHPT